VRRPPGGAAGKADVEAGPEGEGGRASEPRVDGDGDAGVVFIALMGTEVMAWGRLMAEEVTT